MNSLSIYFHQDLVGVIKNEFSIHLRHWFALKVVLWLNYVVVGQTLSPSLALTSKPRGCRWLGAWEQLPIAWNFMGLEMPRTVSSKQRSDWPNRRVAKSTYKPLVRNFSFRKQAGGLAVEIDIRSVLSVNVPNYEMAERYLRRRLTTTRRGCSCMPCNLMLIASAMLGEAYLWNGDSKFTGHLT